MDGEASWSCSGFYLKIPEHGLLSFAEFMQFTKISSGVRSFALDGVLSEAKPELLHLTDLRQPPNASGTKACIKDTVHATAAWESPGHVEGEAQVEPQRTGGSCLRF